MFYERLKGALEALLFAGGDPLPAETIAKILQIDETNVAELVAELQEEMKLSSRGLTITEVAGGYQLCTKPQWADFVNQLGLVQETKLSPAALETLAIIAFRQPVTRQDVEQIRGVKADHIISQLAERGLIKELGRKDAIGRPILYGTTPEFLVCFGLNGLDELPDVSDFLQEPTSN